MSSLGKLSFCLAEEENEALEALRQRLGLHGVLLNRSEVMRTALHYLAEQGDGEVVAAAKVMTRFKPGRRAKSSHLGPTTAK